MPEQGSIPDVAIGRTLGWRPEPGLGQTYTCLWKTVCLDLLRIWTCHTGLHMETYGSDMPAPAFRTHGKGSV